MRGTLTLLLIAAAVTGCAAGPARMTVAQAAPEKAPDGFRAEGGDLVHVASGMRFPARVGSAVRAEAQAYDRDGEHVTILYRLPLRGGGQAEARVGLVHLEGMRAAEHYAVFKATMLGAMPGGRTVDEGAFPIAVAGRTVEGWRGTFVPAAPSQEARGLVTGDFGYWSARLRTRYPPGQAGEGQVAVEAFARALDWSPLLKRA